MSPKATARARVPKSKYAELPRYLPLTLPTAKPTFSHFFPHFSPLACDLSCCMCLPVPNCDPREELCEHGEIFFLSRAYLLGYYKWSYFRQTSSHFGCFSSCAGVALTLLIWLLIREKFQTFASFVNWPTPSCTQAAHALSPSGTTQKFLGGQERMGENPAARQCHCHTKDPGDIHTMDEATR